MPYFLTENAHTRVLAFAIEEPPGSVRVPDEVKDDVLSCMASGRAFRLSGIRLELAPEIAPFDGALWDFDRQAWTDPIDADKRREAQWRNVRLERNQRLSATDWLVARALEAGTTPAPEWVAYRQALRDVTQQADPFAIDWPTPPG